MSEEAIQQLDLRYRLAASSTNLYCEAGFTVVYQDIILGQSLTDVVNLLKYRPLHVVVLRPTPDSDDRQLIRAAWDTVEEMMRGYLANLRDEVLFTKPITFEEDKDLITWQVLLHVVNHGTDHRAQMLRLLNDLGVKTGPQDLIFYVYDHLL